MLRHQECLICGSPELRALSGYSSHDLVACRCGMVFCARVPTSEEIASVYGAYDRDKVRADSAASAASRGELMARFARYRRLNRLLDVGCGSGLMLDSAQTHRWETFGTEITPAAVALSNDAGHDVRLGTLATVDLEASSFDVIVYTEVIEHIHNHREEMPRLLKLLRPGGLLYVTTPNFGSMSRRVLGPKWNVISYPEHLAYFTPATLATLMAAIGFERVWLETTGVSPSRFLTSLRGTSGPPETRASSADTIVRDAITRRRTLQDAKRLINHALTWTNLGDTIKAGFVRPAR